MEESSVVDTSISRKLVFLSLKSLQTRYALDSLAAVLIERCKSVEGIWRQVPTRILASFRACDFYRGSVELFRTNRVLYGCFKAILATHLL